MSSANILAVYQLASVADLTEGKAWYARAYNIACNLQERYGVSRMKAAGVLAALSPRNKWDRNVIDAENLIQAWQAGGAEACATVKVCTFGGNKAKAIRILELDCPTEQAVLNVLSGPKLKEFYSCIAGIDNEVCIDGHAYSIWTGGRVTLANVPSIGIKLRKQIKADYIAAAAEAGILPYEMQAITWCAWRRIHGVG
jgi:hypothetical protein